MARRIYELSGVSVVSLCSKGPVVFVGPPPLSSISAVTVTYLVDKIEWRRGLISILGLAFGSVPENATAGSNFYLPYVRLGLPPYTLNWEVDLERGRRRGNC